MTRNIHPTGISNVLKREMTDKKIQKTVLYLRCRSTGICYVLIHKLGTLSISMQCNKISTYNLNEQWTFLDSFWIFQDGAELNNRIII